MSEPYSKILIIDRDKLSASYLKVTLSRVGYSVYTATSAYETITGFKYLSPDIVLLDPDLKDMYAFDLISLLRKEQDVPIIIISDKKSDNDRLSAFAMGADDYLTKPFATAELITRMKTTLRRMHKYDKVVIFHSGELSVDFDKRTVSVGDKTIKLTMTEYSLITLLAKSAGKVLTYSEIIRRIWGKNSSTDVNLLHVNIAHIRKKLGEEPKHPKYILTENGVGYRMSAN